MSLCVFREFVSCCLDKSRLNYLYVVPTGNNVFLSENCLLSIKDCVMF